MDGFFYDTYFKKTIHLLKIIQISRDNQYNCKHVLNLPAILSLYHKLRTIK